MIGHGHKQAACDGPGAPFAKPDRWPLRPGRAGGAVLHAPPDLDLDLIMLYALAAPQSEIGVDAGAYARQLMNAAVQAADAVPVNDLSPQVSQQRGAARHTAQGSPSPLPCQHS